MNTATRKIGAPYKPRGTMKKETKVLIELLLKHGDHEGKKLLATLDAAQPGWDAPFKSRMWVTKTAERLKRTGVLAFFKANPSGLSADVAAVVDTPLTREQVQDEIAKSARKMARKELLEMLAEVQFCPKCGNPLHRLFLQAASHTNGD